MRSQFTRPDLNAAVPVLHRPGRGDRLAVLLHRLAPEPLLRGYEGGVEDVGQTCVRVIDHLLCNYHINMFCWLLRPSITIDFCFYESVI